MARNIRGENFFVPWVSFFLSFSLLCLLKTREEVWQSLRSRSLFKSACQRSRQKPCVSETLSITRDGLESHQTRTSTFKLTKLLLKHTRTHTQCSHVGWVIVFFALQKFKSARFYSVKESFFSLFLFFDGERGAKDEKHI